MKRCWCFWLLVLGLCGCPGTGPAEVTHPFKGEQVTLVVPSGMGFKETWEDALNDWSAETGATVDVTEVDFGTAAKPAKMPELAAGSLVLFPVSRLPELADAKSLSAIPVPDNSAGREGAVDVTGWNDIQPGVREKLCSPGQRPVVLPVCVPVLAMYYREDLLAKANLRAPQTWGDYQSLLEKLPEWAPGKTAVEPWSPEFRSTMFLARAVSITQHPSQLAVFFDAQTSAPQIGNAGFQRALEQARAAVALMPPQVLTYSPADCRRELLEGRAALGVAWETGPESAPLAFGPRGAANVKRADGVALGIERLPGSDTVYDTSRRVFEPTPSGQVNQVTLVGSMGLVAGLRPGGSDKGRDAAWNLASRLWGPNSKTLHPPGTRLAFRVSDADDAGSFVGSDLRGSEAGAYVQAASASLHDRNVTVEIPVVGQEEFRSALARGLEGALKGEQKPEEALRAIDREWRQIKTRLGQDLVRESHRRALGLSP